MAVSAAWYGFKLPNQCRAQTATMRFEVGATCSRRRGVCDAQDIVIGGAIFQWLRGGHTRCGRTNRSCRDGRQPRVVCPEGASSETMQFADHPDSPAQASEFARAHARGYALINGRLMVPPFAHSRQAFQGAWYPYETWFVPGRPLNPLRTPSKEKIVEPSFRQLSGHDFFGFYHQTVHDVRSAFGCILAHVEIENMRGGWQGLPPQPDSAASRHRQTL